MMARWTLQTLFSILLIVGMVGCAPAPRRFSKAEIVGTYQIQYSFGTETLVLRADDTYEQRFVDISGKVFTARGGWTFHSQETSNQGALENAMLVCDGFGKFDSTVPKPGLHLLSFAWDGGIVISLNEDLGLVMRKVK